MIKCIQQILSVFIILGSCFLIVAQNNFNKENDSLALDKSVLYGRLDNGLTYYIKHVEESSKVYLKLLVNVGSYDEDNSQWQLAHTLEHLAFRESSNFPNGGVTGNVGVLENNNMKQLDIKGYTFNNYTNYIFDAPSENIEALNLGLLWFKDIVDGGLKLYDNTIENERGIVSQELIGKINDPEMHFADIHLKSILFPGTLKVDNFNGLRIFNPADLRRFYKDWYRPNLMAISVVGNIKDAKWLEKEIKKQFSLITQVNKKKSPVNHYNIYLQQPPKFTLVKRHSNSSLKGDQKSEIRVFFRDRIANEQQYSWLRIQQNVLWELFEQILNERFKHISNTYTPFFKTNGYYQTNEAFPAFRITITSDQGKEREAMHKVMQVIGQIRDNGVLKEELNKMKSRQLGYFKSGQKNHQYWERGIKEHFIYGNAFPTGKEKYISDWLSSLSLDEFNEFLSEVISKQPEDIGIIVQEGKSDLSYTDQEVRLWIKESLRNNSNKTYSIPEIPEDLLTNEVLEGLEQQKYIDNGTVASGVYKYTLNNGIKVILNSFEPSPEYVKRGDVIMQGFSQKGANMYSKEDYFTAINASNIVINSGVGVVDKFQLKDYISKKGLKLNVFPYIYFNESGIRGDADLENLESMLQLVYLYFTQPRKDSLAFKDWKFNELDQYVEGSHQFENDFRYKVNKITGDTLILEEQPGIGKTLLKGEAYYMGINKTDLDRGYTIYQQLFGDAGDFTFIFCGDFSKSKLLTLVNKYLGNLPNSKETNHGVIATQIPELQKGPVNNKIEIYKSKKEGDLSQGFYNMKFIKRADNHRDWKEQVKVKFLGILTSLKLKSLRQKGLPLYNFGAGGSFNKDLLQYEVSLYLKTDSEYFPIIQKECKQIVSDIKGGKIEEDLFKNAYSQTISFYSDLRLNQNYVKSYLLYEHFRYKKPLVDPSILRQYLDSLTIQDMVTFAGNFYAKENQFEFESK